MVVSTNRPYFAPFPGFFSKARQSDALVLMDNVQFPRGTCWLNRNRFKNDQGPLWLTVPVWKKGRGLQNIDEVELCNEGRWQERHFKSLKTAYGNAPFLVDNLDFLKDIFSGNSRRLVTLNLKIINYLMGYLNIFTKIVLLSELGIKEKEPRLSVAVCEKLKATRYLAQAGAEKYLDLDMFHEAGIEVAFFKYRAPVYPQLWGTFISNLSTFDLAFNCGPKSVEIL
ncbi:WbqC family protein [Thermodesulfobacteriota bacterium]